MTDGAHCRLDMLRRSSSMLSVAVAILVGCSATSARGEDDVPPSELTACSPVCREALSTGLILDCDSSVLWTQLAGRELYGPLTCIGQVRIGLEARPPGQGDIELPLHVGYRTGASASQCFWSPATHIWNLVGVTTCDQDSMWVWSPLIDLHRLIPIGTEYWIQLEGFGGYDPWLRRVSSPFIRCLRVEAFPINSIEKTTWTLVRQLYRENLLSPRGPGHHTEPSGPRR